MITLKVKVITLRRRGSVRIHFYIVTADNLLQYCTFWLKSVRIISADSIKGVGVLPPVLFSVLVRRYSFAPVLCGLLGILLRCNYIHREIFLGVIYRGKV